jgi:hypothetical protein
MNWPRIARASAAVGLGVTASLTLWSLLPGVSPAPGLFVALAFIGLFPTFGGMVIVTARRQHNQGKVGWSRRPVSKGLPFALPWWIPIIGVLSLICFFSAMASLPGQPEQHGGAYFFDDHGSLIRTTHAGYLRGLRAQQRIFAAIPALFYSVALAGWSWVIEVRAREPNIS